MSKKTKIIEAEQALATANRNLIARFEQMKCATRKGLLLQPNETEGLQSPGRP